MDVFSAAGSSVPSKKPDVAPRLHMALCNELQEESQKMADN